MLMREINLNADELTIDEFINAEAEAEQRVVQEELDACLNDAYLGEDFDMKKFEKCVKEPVVAKFLVALLKSLARANVTLTDIGELLQKIKRKLT